MVWGYMEPIPECPKIKELLCFFHERGCDIYVDGEKIPQPKTKWARELKILSVETQCGSLLGRP